MSEPDNITNFPKWRENNTAVEALEEVLQYARLRPKEVQRVVIIFEDGDCARTVRFNAELRLGYAIGLMELAKHDLMTPSETD